MSLYVLNNNTFKFNFIIIINSASPRLNPEIFNRFNRAIRRDRHAIYFLVY